ncbi:MAG TPA: MFS transporter [Solirubrobacteraceae bacterium]
MSEQVDKGDRAALLAIVAEGFFSRLSFGLLTFALPIYARDKLGLSLAEVGLLASFNMIVAIALKPAMGALADRFGLKRILTTSIAFRSAVTLLLAFAAVPWQIFAARGVHGVSISMRDPALGAILAEHGGKKKVAQSFAWYQTAKTVAGNGSKVASGVLLSVTHRDFAFVFFVAFALSLIPLLVVAAFVREKGVTHTVSAAEEAAPPPRPEGVSKGRVASFASLGCMIAGSAYMMNALLPVFLTEYTGLGDVQAAVIYAISPAVALTGPGFGWLSDNFSRKLVLSVRSVANILSSVVYLLFTSFPGAIVGRATDDLGKAAFKPAWGALLAQLTDLDKKRRATLFGYISSGEDAGEALGPILGGALASLGGFPLMLAGRIVMAAITEVYTVLVTHSLESHGKTITGRETYRVSIAVPVRVALGLLLSFGAGWAAGEVRRPDRSRASPAPAPASERPAADDEGRCSSDPTIGAIQKQLGEC